MNLLAIAFYVFSGLMIVFAVLVVGLRNPVSSAMSLVMTFLCLAALFVTLDAYFIGTIQVLVYAGAVMVLFLFIIMLLDLKAESLRRLNGTAVAGGLLVSGAFLYTATLVVLRSELSRTPLEPLPEGRLNDVAKVGEILFTEYTLPFQIVGALLLVATVGVVVLSRRELR